MPVPKLSTIEEHVVLLVARGARTEAIADQLGVSVTTVDWHLARARRKLERAAALHDRVRQANRASVRKED